MCKTCKSKSLAVDNCLNDTVRYLFFIIILNTAVFESVKEVDLLNNWKADFLKKDYV